MKDKLPWSRSWFQSRPAVLCHLLSARIDSGMLSTIGEVVPMYDETLESYHPLRVL